MFVQVGIYDKNVRLNYYIYFEEFALWIKISVLYVTILILKLCLCLEIISFVEHSTSATMIYSVRYLQVE